MHKKTIKRRGRILFSFLLLFLLLYFNEFEQIRTPQQGDPPLLYASICHDNLQKIFLEAVQKANQSIVLTIYSLTDYKLIEALNKKANEGIEVRVIHDLSTPSFGWMKLNNKVHREGIKMSGLMHQKILIIDHEDLWLGSANWTTESLKLHDNLVMALNHPLLAQAIENKDSFFMSSVGEQNLEYWSLPSKAKEGLERIIQLLDQAEHSIKIAMFTWTHDSLIQAVIRAHNRGVAVEVLMDKNQSQGVCQNTIKKLSQSGVDLHISAGLGLLHHKCAWIDEEILIHGSANWTAAAFSRNRDCFVVLYPLTSIQKEKLRKMWYKTKAEARTTADSLPLAA